jgi:glutathione S-transferase
MNLRSHHANFRIFTGAKPDIARIEAIWAECFERYGGPFLFGRAPSVADAMFAPVTRRFITYDVDVSAESAAYCRTIGAWRPMIDWIEAAAAEPEEMEELDLDF